LSGSARFRGNQCGVELPRQMGDNFVLHIEDIGERLVKPINQQGFRLVPAVLPASPSGMLSRASRWASDLP
jgi:hypothetical protein